MSTERRCFGALLGAMLFALRLDGQAVPKSQHGTVTQMVGGTEITVAYNRPSARGRQLFGGVVRYGRVWNPGADQATTLAVGTEVRIAGQPLPAGKYSVWMIPAKEGPWTVIFSRAADVFHVPYPEGQDALRVQLEPERGRFMETLAFYFPVVTSDSTVLAFHWGETVISIPVAVKP